MLRSISSDSDALQFAWKSEIKNAEYDFEISKNKEFSDIFYSEKIENSTFLRKNIGALSSWSIPDGTYFWRVIRKASEPDDFTPQSDIRSFSVQKIAKDKNRLVYPPENFSVDPQVLPGQPDRLKDIVLAASGEAFHQQCAILHFGEVQRCVAVVMRRT